MASRPIFFPKETGNTLVSVEAVEFEWFPGMSLSQKQKSIQSLHRAAQENVSARKYLEVSSKSEDDIGTKLSAFNLKYTNKTDACFSVECLYQSSKVFEQGGPFRDLLKGSSLDAKRDVRLKESGNLKHFLSQTGLQWSLEPKTAFYDWTYINVLAKNKDLHEPIMKYDGFTDIEYNPKKSINCQAYSVALFTALYKRGLLSQALETPEKFKDTILKFKIVNANEDQHVSPRLI